MRPNLAQWGVWCCGYRLTKKLHLGSNHKFSQLGNNSTKEPFHSSPRNSPHFRNRDIQYCVHNSLSFAPRPSRKAQRPIQPLVNRYRVFPGGTAAGGVVPSPLLAPRLRMCWIYTTACPLCLHRHITGRPLPLPLCLGFPSNMWHKLIPNLRVAFWYLPTCDNRRI